MSVTPTISGILGQHAAPRTFEHAGKVYQIRAFDQRAKSAFEEWLKKEARRTIAGMREYLSDSDFDRTMQAFRDDCILGKFAYHGAIAQQVSATVTGFLAILGILFGTTEEEVIRLTTDRPEEVAAITDEILLESLPREQVARIMADRKKTKEKGSQPDPNPPAGQAEVA